MLQELLRLLPSQPGNLALALSVAFAALGVGFWLTGARFHRGLVTLAAVAAGALLGEHLPRWYSVPLDGWVWVIVLAMAFGIAGYAWHQQGVGIVLGLVLAAWATALVWVFRQTDPHWVLPPLDASLTAIDYLRLVWAEAPEDVRRLLPFAAPVSFMAGVGLGIIWSRLAVILLYSLGGASLAMGGGMAAANSLRPAWALSLASYSTTSQLLAMVVVVVIGLAIQFSLGPARRPAGPAGKKSEES